MKLTIDAERLTLELNELAKFSEVPAPAVTRIVFSDEDMRARRYVNGLCMETGLPVREDAVGNTFARWNGSAPNEPAIGTGSHIDAIPNAGMFDGTVGVLGGLEAIRCLQRSGFQPRRSIELLLFTSEEPTRFGIGCLGSRLLSGALDAKAGESIRDREGRSLDDLRQAAGFTGTIESVRLQPGYYAGFVELHIEQGSLLEKRGVPLGVVTAIAAPASLRLQIDGEGGHAGAVLMPNRHDAFLAAAEIALAVERSVLATGSVDTVGTSGVCEVFPGAVNSIPSGVRLELDIRDIDAARRDGVIGKVRAAASEVAEKRGVRVRIEVVNADQPATCDASIVEELARSCDAQSLKFDPMISRAYHDSLFVSRFAPTAMLFIPCRNGVSHRPDEYSSPEAIAAGVLVLAQTLANLSLRA